MAPRFVDVTLDNLAAAPEEVLGCVFWELEGDPPVDPRFEKEEWFSSTLLEWGGCGKLALEDERAVAFAQYAPPSLFPRAATFPAGRVSPDAAYLAHCYVVEGRRGSGLGSEMLRAVARELVDRGVRAVEALGAFADEHRRGGAVLPAAFLSTNRFEIVRDDDAVPLWRLDLYAAPADAETAARARVSLPR